MQHPRVSWTIGSALVAIGTFAAQSVGAGEAGGHQSHVAVVVAQPQEPGQSAFAAIAEIVELLEADPATDWTQVDLGALRQHLVDMNELTLRAESIETEIEGGVLVTLHGQGRTLEAIHRMIPAHAPELDRFDIWTASAKVEPDGAALIVTSADPAEVERIRGLGFIGLMVTGVHHQAHHIAVARGLPAHGGH